MKIVGMPFVIFVAVTVGGYYMIPKNKRWIWLLAVSIFFYLQAGWQCVPFVLTVTCGTYGAALYMAKLKEKKRRKFVLGITVAGSLSILLFIKYYNYSVGMLGRWFAWFRIPELNLLLPLGISFYTLQVVGYCIDVYREKYLPEKNLAKYALFVLFFPQIVQGPIARYDQFIPCILEHSKIQNKVADGDLKHTCMLPEFQNIIFGFQLVLWGYLKKMVLADRMAILVNQVFNQYYIYRGFQIFIASFFYTIQIYSDFSGFVDISRGISQMLGIKLSENFNHPYFSTTIKNFWHRWHISLSTWFRDYLYIPLGGNRKGRLRTYLNILIVFGCSGIWHGAGFHFLVWGLLHGLYQVLGQLLMPIRNRCVDKLGINRNSFIHKLCKIFVTFQLVNFAWIFFRANSLSSAIKMVWYMVACFNPWILFDGSLYSLGLDEKDFMCAVIALVLLFIVSVLQERYLIRKELSNQGVIAQFVITLAGIFIILIFGIYGPGYNAEDFIYANF